MNIFTRWRPLASLPSAFLSQLQPAKPYLQWPGQVKVTPHKYEDGHYLTVTPTAAADKQFRIVFETARGRVTRYRAGLMPSVEYVEGCS